MTPSRELSVTQCEATASPPYLFEKILNVQPVGQ